jgi:transcriptional regulator with XRE-family HTH domain
MGVAKGTNQRSGPSGTRTLRRAPEHNAPNRLLEFRARRLLTQPQLAEAAGVSIWLISQTELGNHRPGPLSQEKLARFFGVPRDVIFPVELEEASA